MEIRAFIDQFIAPRIPEGVTPKPGELFFIDKIDNSVVPTELKALKSEKQSTGKAQAEEKKENVVQAEVEPETPPKEVVIKAAQPEVIKGAPLKPGVIYKNPKGDHLVIERVGDSKGKGEIIGYSEVSAEGVRKNKGAFAYKQPENFEVALGMEEMKKVGIKNDPKYEKRIEKIIDIFKVKQEIIYNQLDEWSAAFDKDKDRYEENIALYEELFTEYEKISNAWNELGVEVVEQGEQRIQLLDKLRLLEDKLFAKDILKRDVENGNNNRRIQGQGSGKMIMKFRKEKSRDEIAADELKKAHNKRQSSLIINREQGEIQNTEVTVEDLFSAIHKVGDALIQETEQIRTNGIGGSERVLDVQAINDLLTKAEQAHTSIFAGNDVESNKKELHRALDELTRMLPHQPSLIISKSESLRLDPDKIKTMPSNEAPAQENPKKKEFFDAVTKTFEELKDQILKATEVKILWELKLGRKRDEIKFFDLSNPIFANYLGDLRGKDRGEAIGKVISADNELEELYQAKWTKLGETPPIQPSKKPRAKNEKNLGGQEKAQEKLETLREVIEAKKKWARDSFNPATTVTQEQFDNLIIYLDKLQADADSAFTDVRYKRIHHILGEARKAAFTPEKPKNGKLKPAQPSTPDLDDVARIDGERHKEFSDEERAVAVRLSKKETAKEKAEKVLVELEEVVEGKLKWAQAEFENEANGYTQGQYDQLKEYLQKLLPSAAAAVKSGGRGYKRPGYALKEALEAKFEEEKTVNENPTSPTETVGQADQVTADNKVRNKIFPKAEIFEGTRELEISIADGPVDSSTGEARPTFVLTIDGEKITVLGSDKDFTGKMRTITGKVSLDYDASRTYNNVKVTNKDGDEVDLMTGKLIFHKDGGEREALFFDATLDTLHELKELFSQESKERTYEELFAAAEKGGYSYTLIGAVASGIRTMKENIPELTAQKEKYKQQIADALIDGMKDSFEMVSKNLGWSPEEQEVFVKKIVADSIEKFL